MDSCDEHKRCRWENVGTEADPTLSEGQCKENHVNHGGWCGNWQEGSSWRTLGYEKSYWGPEEGMTHQAECWAKCHSDPACRQAVYKQNETENVPQTYCWIGLNTMDCQNASNPDECVDRPAKTTGCHSSCHEYCYAKDGFDPTEHERDVLTADVLSERVKSGWCADWVQGGGQIGLPRQCDISEVEHPDSDYPENACSHWGPEFDLSERGCWEKCETNPTCTQAVYRDNFRKYACWIGTRMMSTTPTASDMFDRCYDKAGNYNFQVGVNTMGNASLDAEGAQEQCSDEGGSGISDKYPCLCGTAVCLDQTMCDKSTDGGLDHCRPQQCSSQRPDDISHTYPCTCTTGVTCTNETVLCDAENDRCHAMDECSDKTGSVVHESAAGHPCECGTLACIAGTRCKIGETFANGTVVDDDCSLPPAASAIDDSSGSNPASPAAASPTSAPTPAPAAPA